MNTTGFLSQGGYAFYVWMSFGAAAALILFEIIQVRRERRTILSRLGRLMRMRPRGGDQ